MAYSAETDLNLSETRKIELTEAETAVGVKDATLIAALQTRAYNKINAALYGKYSTPVSPVPPILTELESDLWRYYLYTHREIMEVPKSVQDDYAYAMDLLEKYRTGDELLNGVHTSAATGPSPTVGSFSDDSDARVFGRVKDRGL